MLRFQQGDGQMTNRRKDVIVHTGECAPHSLSTIFVGLKPVERHGLKAFVRRSGRFFSNTLLCGIDILRQLPAENIALLPGLNERNQRICAQTYAGFLSVEAILEVPDTRTARIDEQIQTV